MKSKILLVILTIAFGAAFALPTQAATPAADQPTLKENWAWIVSQINYEVINATNGAVVNLTSTNPNWVTKAHEKYDSLSKTSMIIADGQIELDLIKLENGIQLLVTVLHPTGDNYQELINKVQAKVNSPKPTFYRIMKTGLFLKNHFGWAL